MLFLLVMIMKSVAWFFAFRFGTRSDLKGMLLSAAGVTLLLTVIDKFSVAANLALPAILLTLLLYALMSFILFPIAWKLRNGAVSVIFNVIGMLGAFAGVNFVMDFLRGVLQFMNK
jgi:hypothetical protein